MAGSMPRIGPDPFEQINRNNEMMYRHGMQNEQNAQEALMRMFITEASRQEPFVTLPATLAKQNNAANVMLDRQKDLYDYKVKVDEATGNFKIPTDAADLGSNIIDNLQKDLGISAEAAAGIVGNLASETGNFRHMQELDPTVPGSRGGAGWAQWTGPRRKDFEAFTGGDISSPEANYKYLVHDLKNNYPQVLKQLQSTTDPLAAARIIHDNYLIPGVKHIRKSAINTMKYYETYNAHRNKRTASDAEYDRKQARRGTDDEATAMWEELRQYGITAGTPDETRGMVVGKHPDSGEDLFVTDY